MSEQSVASARASVLLYDSNLKKWIPSGSSSGIAKVHIYHNKDNNSFRIVGRKVQDHEVVINCSILKGLKYFQATPTFHQWRDNAQIHGLNFASREDAEIFALAMERVLDILGHSSMYLTSSRSNQSQPLYQTIGHSGVSLDDYAEYRGWVNHENGDRKSSADYGHYRPTHGNSIHVSSPSSLSPSAYGLPRANAVPPPQAASPQAPPPPPPPPPPPSNPSLSGLATLPRLHLPKSEEQQEMSETSLAAAIATAKLKRTPVKPNDPAANENKPFQMKGMASIMDEMARTLARRRAQTDGSADMDNISIGSDSNRSWLKSGSTSSPNKNSEGDSPQSIRSRSDTDAESKDPYATMNDLLRFKHEIFMDLKEELHKVKQDIIDAIKMEIHRR